MKTIITFCLLVTLLLSGCIRPVQPAAADSCASIGQSSLIRECQDH